MIAIYYNSVTRNSQLWCASENGQHTPAVLYAGLNAKPLQWLQGLFDRNGLKNQSGLTSVRFEPSVAAGKRISGVFAFQMKLTPKTLFAAVRIGRRTAPP